MRKSVLCAALFGAFAAAGEITWIEGEKPSRDNTGAKASGWGNLSALSGGAWLNGCIEAADAHAKEPAGGWLVAYDFTAQGGSREVWGHIGYEFVRAAFDWRVDGGDWKSVDPQSDRTTCLEEISNWCEVGWLRFGSAELASTKSHSLEIRFPKKRDAKGNPARILFGLDAFVLASPGAFVPNGGIRPGTPATEDEKAAARKVYALGEAKADGSRTEIPLTGLWQYARCDETEFDNATRAQPIASLPSEPLAWSAISVPGDRNKLKPSHVFAHRFLYRTKLFVPASYKGGSLVLDFERANMLASVFVNGRLAGTSEAAASGFRVDISKFATCGAENEIVVAFKDGYYALGVKGVPDLRTKFNVPPGMFYRLQATARNLEFPTANAHWAGLFEEVRAVATPAAVYADDIYAIPSVEKGELTVEVTLRGTPGAAASVALAVNDGPSFPAKDVTLGADGAVTFDLTVPWKDAVRWSPENPHLYTLSAIVTSGNRRDVSETPFGFRQWKVVGKTLTLNGVPWQMRATCDDMSVGADGVEKALAGWKKKGQSQFRMMYQNGWGGASREKAFAIFDRVGMPVRTEPGLFDGQVAAYGLVDNSVRAPNATLFANWMKQLAAGMRRYRNHPCIYSWQLENEIVFINTRNFGWLKEVEPFIREGAALIAKLDRQGRPAACEGGRALMDQSLAVNGCHYEMMPIRDYPDAAYSLDCWKTPTRSQPWPMAVEKPVFLNEEYFAAGNPVSYFAEAGGEGCFLGRGACREAASLVGRMMSEGWRWQGLAGWHFWLGSAEVTPDLYASWQPTCALVREWDAAFFANAKVKRTVMVRNDNTFDAEPIEFKWTFAGKGGRATLAVPPGDGRTTDVLLEMPSVSETKEFEFVYSCTRRGKEVFRDAKRYRVFPKSVAKLSGKIAYLGPAASPARARLAGLGLSVRDLAGFESVSKLAADELLVVGPGALSAREATDPVWADLAARGRRMIVLEQKANLHYQAIAADVEPTDDCGTIAFPQNAKHPAFAGLDTGDLRFWGPDHTVYRRAFAKPESGAESLVQCGPELRDCALAEARPGDGLVLLSQLTVGEKLATSPVAAKLFDNLVAHALSYRPLRRAVTSCLPGDVRARSLAESGLSCRTGKSVVEALESTPGGIVVADGTEATFKELLGSGPKAEKFFAGGGYLMLWNVGEKSLAAFNAFAGTDFILRPFRREKVEIPFPRDPLVAGLSQRDVTLFSGEKIFAWRGDRYIADDVFTSVVDLEDVAPFARGFGIPANLGEGQSVINNMTSAEGWKYIVYQDYSEQEKCPPFTWRLRRPEKICRFSIAPNGHYQGIREFRLVFNGDSATARTFELAPFEKSGGPRTDFDIVPSVRATSVSLEPVSFYDIGSTGKKLTGIDNIWITAERDAAWKAKVVPLLNVGGLVFLPRGKGGVILNQVHLKDHEATPENGPKKRAIVLAVLRNLGGVFAARKTVRPGEGLVCEPISFEGVANVYLDSQKGFPDRKDDLTKLPPGEGRYAGVKYEIRDFRTSPLPSAVSLEGLPGNRNLPKSVEIPVGKKADALFFLHAYWPSGIWKRRRPTDAPPSVFAYDIRYADGKHVTFPVVYARTAGPWKTADEVSGLSEAALGWTVPANGGGNIALYSAQWTNPRPEVAVKSVTLRYGPDGRRWGSPLLLGLTAARLSERQ